MNFTDIFVRRPVLATVVSLLILVLGLRAVRHPAGAAISAHRERRRDGDDDLLRRRSRRGRGLHHARRSKNAIAQANGIDYMTSTSHERRQHDHRQSAAELRFQQGADRDQHQGQLGAEPPAAGSRSSRCCTVKIGQTIDAMYIGFSSNVAGAQPDHRLSDPRGAAASCRRSTGVQTAELLGAQEFRAARLARPGEARGLRPDRRRRGPGACRQRLHLGPRQHQGPDGAGQPDAPRPACIRSRSSATSCVKQENGAIVRLSDVANVTLGAEDYDTEVAFDGQKAVYIGIQVAPIANLLDVDEGRARRLSRRSRRSCRRA